MCKLKFWEIVSVSFDWVYNSNYQVLLVDLKVLQHKQVSRDHNRDNLFDEEAAVDNKGYMCRLVTTSFSYHKVNIEDIA